MRRLNRWNVFSEHGNHGITDYQFVDNTNGTWVKSTEVDDLEKKHKDAEEFVKEVASQNCDYCYTQECRCVHRKARDILRVWNGLL